MIANATPGVFLSYAAEDKDVVLPVVDRLVKHGLSVWVDRHRLTGGMIWAEEIVRAIRQCRVLVLMCSNASLRSRAVTQEIQLAWKYQLAYLPVLLQPVKFTEQLEFFLEGSQWIDAHGAPADDWLPSLVESLKRLNIAVTPGNFGANVTLPSANLDGLRHVAKFTDRIWPLVVDNVERSADKVDYIVRDLGQARESARHEIRLGSSVFWAIEWDQVAHLLLLDEAPDGKIYCLCPSWFCPRTQIKPGISLLPPKSAHCEPFVLTGDPGREQILAILTAEPWFEHWMPYDRKTPARVLSSSDILELTQRIRQSDAGTWTALATYCDIVV